jgi:hypothetical protein
MHKIISGVQTAFVKGRQILDGVLIANEVIEEARRLKREVIFLKVDFEKAYDSVDWDFLEFVMSKMNFPSKLRKWIRESLSSAMISVLINGSPTKEFKMERGLRQGDPLSPFLFLMVAEGFNCLMSKAVMDKEFLGYGVGSDEELTISHLQFADDTLVIGKRRWSNIFTLKANLQLFELISGLKVNFYKSELIGINIEESWLKDAASALNCKVGSLPFNYLGLPIGADPRKLRTWEPVIKSLRRRLLSWKNRALSMGGRLVLLKSVLTALPIYFLSFFKAPSGIISLTESLFKSFLWGESEEAKKIHWVKWDRICMAKDRGGLGVRDLRAFNNALLGKWWWRIRTEKEALWYKVLEQKYGDKVDEWNRSRSQWWRDLISIRKLQGRGGEDWFEENIRREVGDGKNTYFWKDPWVEGESLCSIFRRLYDLSLDKEMKVADMIDEEEGVDKINWRWRRNLFEWEKEMVEVCEGVVLSVKRRDGEEDCWKWRDENYTVKEAYRVIKEGDEEGETKCEWYKDVWNQLIPSNMSTLVWRLFLKRLPTKENLIRRGIMLNSSALCVGGCGNPETEEHLFFNCPMLGSVWRKIVNWLGVPLVLPEGGYIHLNTLKNMVPCNIKIRDKIAVIWFSTISSIWRTRNDMIFNHTGYDWEKLFEEIKIRSWRILRARSKGFSYDLSMWRTEPLVCLGAV